MAETTAGVEQPHRWTRFQGGYVCADCHARYIGLQDACPAARAEQPRPTEIRDPILRLFVEEILRQTPSGEAIRVTYRPNGEWSVLPEAIGADGDSRQPAPRADDALPIARMLGDLLATIHRDGGYRQDEVGTEQAWMEAMMTVPFLLEAKDAALASDEPTAAKGD